MPLPQFYDLEMGCEWCQWGLIYGKHGSVSAMSNWQLVSWNFWLKRPLLQKASFAVNMPCSTDCTRLNYVNTRIPLFNREGPPRRLTMELRWLTRVLNQSLGSSVFRILCTGC